jgi:tRNA A58 N-methylase Trm61
MMRVLMGEVHGLILDEAERKNHIKHVKYVVNPENVGVVVGYKFYVMNVMRKGLKPCSSVG